ncbi:MAG: hypothetical protein RLZZ196_2922 [Bacteroidota bacterium]|jgi:hypothetical protein
MRANEFLTEAPLTDYVPINFDKDKGQFKSIDKRLITHPTTISKAQKVFERIPYHVRLFFVNKPGLRNYREIGAQSPDKILEILGKDADKILTGSEDAITILYIGNYGVDKIMMTPWIMAHRFGHAITATNRFAYGTTNVPNDAWSQTERLFFSTINEILKDAYGIRRATDLGDRQYTVNWNVAREYNALFNAIGTQRSSRENRINRPYEFLYELFAQYLVTGSVKLNPLPKSIGYGRKAWGRIVNYLIINKQYSANKTETLAHDMKIMFDSVISSQVGKIFVM